ncbi:MAG: MarR family transcriptional regulator [Ignavibacteria bacterium]|nr:MarR family transcriptional regulator [Ignavibacteria bacterium]
MNTIKQLGYIAMGTRLRMLTDKFITDADKIYNSLDVDFEPRLFTVFYLINQKKSITITELAEQLGYTQPAVTQIANVLISKKLINSVKEKKDSRKKILTITKKGEDLLLELIPVWQDIENSVKELINETGYDVLFVLSKLESELEKKDIFTRVMEKTKKRQIEEVKIFEYSSDSPGDALYKKELNKNFRDLNYEWIKKYFKVEKEDKKQLENPGKEIIEKGGIIFFAEYKDMIAGTAALLKKEDNSYELAKMAVRDEVQGKQIGKKLGFAVIDKVKQLKCDKLYLETNASLTPAINLYKSIGFEEVEMKDPSKYERATFRMNYNFKK